MIGDIKESQQLHQLYRLRQTSQEDLESLLLWEAIEFLLQESTLISEQDEGCSSACLDAYRLDSNN